MFMHFPTHTSQLLLERSPNKLGSAGMNLFRSGAVGVSFLVFSQTLK